jgi:hypothetical protein
MVFNVVVVVLAPFFCVVASEKHAVKSHGSDAIMAEEETAC